MRIEKYVEIGMIPFGKSHAISRRDLSDITHVSDRTVRDDISILRRRYVICSSSSGKGYYRPECRADIEGFIKETTVRALSIFLSLKLAKNVLKNWYQPDLEGME